MTLPLAWVPSGRKIRAVKKNQVMMSLPHPHSFREPSHFGLKEKELFHRTNDEWKLKVNACVRTWKQIQNDDRNQIPDYRIPT